MFEINDIIDEIKNKIVSKYPFLNIFLKKNDDSYFIMVDDKQLYGSDEFLDLINDIYSEILFPKRIGNIYIYCILDKEENSENYYQIYESKSKSIGELLDEVEQHFKNISDDEFKIELERLKDAPLTKLLEHAFGCNRCFEENKTCKSCIFGE